MEEMSTASRELALITPRKGTEMELVVTGQRVADYPSDEQIHDALDGLDVGRDGEGFVILALDEMTYVQVGGDKTITFDMEYQEGEVSRHFRAKRTDFSMEEIEKALIEYRDGNIDWSQYGQWEKEDW